MIWSVFLFGFWLSRTVQAEVSGADLLRAQTSNPRDAFKGADSFEVASVLNAHLLSTRGLDAVPCSNMTLDDVVGVKRKLWSVRDDKFESIYRRNGRDGRMMGTFGRFTAELSELEELWQEESDLIEGHPELHDMARDAKCREAVMWWAHHTTEHIRKALIESDGFTLPLMPVAEPKPTTNDTLALSTSTRMSEAVDQSNACTECHYLDDSHAGKGPGIDPDAGHWNWTLDWNNPTPRPWPSNVSYYIYAGASGCCEPDNPWTQRRSILRFLDVDPPQQLEINEVCNNRGDGTCCILDECFSGEEPEWPQYEGCHIFYNGSEVWEWYPEEKLCTKLLSGAGLVVDRWFSNSNTSKTYMGLEVMGNVPDVTQNITCLKFCDHTPLGLQCYWMFEDGRPCKHHFPDGIDQYTEFNRVGEAAFARIQRPEYCPSWDTKAVMPTPPNFPDQDWICTKCWLNKDVCGTKK